MKLTQIWDIEGESVGLFMVPDHIDAEVLIKHWLKYRDPKEDLEDFLHNEGIDRIFVEREIYIDV